MTVSDEEIDSRGLTNKFKELGERDIFVTGSLIEQNSR
jgi:hypothetical protein